MGWACHTYYNVNPFIGLCRHESMMTVPAPPFQVPAPLLHLDFGLTQGLWLGSFPSTGRGKQIRGDGLWFLGRMSDAGLGVPHISTPPSWFNLLTSLFAMSNATFGASSVQMACHNILWGNDDCDVAATPLGLAPYSVNLGCFEPFCLPTDACVVWGSVYVGLSWNDICAALLDIAISMATDVLTLGIGFGLGKLGRKIGKSSTNKVVKFFTGTLSAASYDAYAKRAVATQGIGNALAMSDDDMARFVTKTGSEEALEGTIKQLDTGFEAFFKEWGDQLDEGLDETWEQGFKEALEELDALKAAGLADDVARRAAAQTLLEDAFEELAVAVRAVAKTDLVAALLYRAFKGTLSSALGGVLLSGNALGAGTEGGALSFDGAGWTSWLEVRRSGEEKYGEDDWITLFEEDEADDWGTATGSIDDDDYWYGGTAFDTLGTADATSEDDDDYWYAPPKATFQSEDVRLETRTPEEHLS